MELKQLKDYIKCAIDLESAIYSCDQVISKLHRTSTQLSREMVIPPKPQQVVLQAPQYPERPKEPTSIVKFLNAFIQALFTEIKIKLGVSFGLVLLLESTLCKTNPVVKAWYFTLKDGRYEANLGKAALMMLCIYAFSSLVHIPGCYNEYKEELDEYEKKVAELKEEHEKYQLKLDESYRQKCEQIKKLEYTSQFISKQRADVNAELDKLLKRKVYLQDCLDKLYSHNIVHSTYRSIAALSQIYDYLDSGLVTKLEGPDGAYAQYMQDVRANRICESIEEMGIRISNSITNLQQTFRNELEQAHFAMNSLNSTLNQLNENTCQYNQNVMHQNQYLIQNAEQMNQQLKNININTALTNYNQYLDMKSRNVDGYFVMYM